MWEWSSGWIVAVCVVIAWRIHYEGLIGRIEDAKRRR